MGFCSMLLLSNILLTAWLSTAKGEDSTRTCGPPPPIDNGDITSLSLPEYEPLSSVDYQCQKYYVLKGNKTITCRNGKWSEPPTCLWKCVFHYVENGQSSYWEKIYVQGQSLKVQCYNGYSLQKGQDTMTCTENGWSPPPKCIRINSTRTCGPPPPIDNGDITSLSLPEYEPLSSVDYQCQKYYLLKGNKTITCRNGKWSEPPTCLRKCVFHYVENGQSSYWEKVYVQSQSLKVQCYNGYSLQNGQDTMTCTENGWSPPPKCIRIRKCVFHYVENGQSSYWEKIYVQGQSLKVQCYNGYSLQNGQDTMTCTENGWSPPPKCIRINSTRTCGPPPPIDNGDITSLSLPEYEPLSSVDYQCQKYYLLKGNKTITCRNGKWSEPPTCLHACVIPENIMEAHNIILKWRHTEKIYAQAGEDIEFECKRGYQKARGSPPFRTKCINGTINYPTCV